MKSDFVLLISPRGLFEISIFLKHKQLSVRLFCFSLFTLSYNTFLIFLFESRYLSQVPFLLRTPSILSYLTFPALFLYISFVLQNRERFYWSDLLHAIPPIGPYVSRALTAPRAPASLRAPAYSRSPRAR